MHVEFYLENLRERDLLGRPSRRWEDNIKMDLREVGYDPGEWKDFAEDRDQWQAYVKGGDESPGSLKAS